MHVTVNSQTLARELRRVNTVVPTKTTIPILSYVLLRTGTTEDLILSALDLEVGFQTVCDAKVHQSGMITVPAKKLLDLVEQFPDADVELSLDPHGVKIASGAFESRLQTLPVSEFPALPEVPPGDRTTFTHGSFQSMLKLVRYAIAEKTTKTMVNGALITQSDGIMAMVATDGKRLSLTTRALEHPIATNIIPTKTIDALLTLFPDDAITYVQGERHLFFTAGESVLTSRMIDGKFPQYERIIPRENTQHVQVSRLTLAAALRRVGLVSDTYKTVLLNFTPNMIFISTKSVEIGDAIEAVPITDGPTCQVCVNWSFLLNFLDAASGSVITLSLGAKLLPVLCTDGQQFLNVIMQSRL